MANDSTVLFGKMTPKQRDFVEYYLISLNATEAAIRAGYPSKSARSKGSQLLTYVNIKAAIEARQKKKLEEIELEQNAILTEVQALAFANFTDVCCIGKTTIEIRDFKDIPPAALKAIKRITVKETSSNIGSSTTIMVEMHDKMKALEFFGKYFGMMDGAGGDEGKGNTGDSAARTERILGAARRIAGGRR